MKKISSFIKGCIFCIVITLVFGCNKDSNPLATSTNNKYGAQNAKVTFWKTFSNTGGYVEVSINGEVKGRFNRYFAIGSQGPDCDDTDNGGEVLSLLLPAGSYSYYAVTKDGQFYWQNQFTLTEGECLRYLLH